MKLGFISLLMFCSVYAFSQGGYKISFKVKGWKDFPAYLGHFYGEQTRVNDTANVNSNGEFFFDNKNKLAHGVYFLVLKKGKGNVRVFDFVVSDDQFFTLETDTSDFVQHMKVTGDEDNKLYFENIAYSIDRNKEADPFRKTVKDSTLKEDQKKDALASLNKINDKVLAHQKQVISKYPKTMTARWLKATQIVTIPDPPKLPNGKIDSTFQLRYYRHHFFDNFDLSDDALLRLPQPLYQQKVKEYLEKLIVPQPDSVTQAIYGLVEKTKKNKEASDYLIRSCLVLYQLPEIMGLDEVFVNLYDKYVATGEADSWAGAKTKQNLKEWADKIRSCMIGRSGANLIMQDENFQPKSMYDIKAKYTILFIFNPDCGHCREETPKLLEFYNKDKVKFDLEVYAVSTDTSMKKLRDFIKEFKTPWITVDGPRSYVKEHFSRLYHSDTTPTIFILDDKKKIIAKKLPVKQLEDFLNKHEKFQQTKKPG
ncbi:MAG TPA: thioredoxin-like domain-containing protein [Cyclobacteriaceae bacterium]|jgi:thiol-disulfide isomerase/thioredoxin|nr:thioredoxin-like domain-containing protein [Cyclobacteriaceae bacterium]